MTTSPTKYGTPEKRWAGIGPYYAMFPAPFAEAVIKNYTDKGHVVLDPFAGRGTAVYAAATSGRTGVGIEINPVGWVYTKAKLQTAAKDAVAARIGEIAQNAHYYRRGARRLPAFFHHCYTDKVRAFLLTARNWLNWKQCKVDWTLMALLLVHLHGKRTDSFSNQMRQTKCMSPPYAIRWWKENGHKPPDIDPAQFLTKKLDWRYAKGVPDVQPSHIYLGDSVERLPHVGKLLSESGPEKATLIFTSPPYCGVTNYHYDQWLRLWLLGGRQLPGPAPDSKRGKFVDRLKFKELLKSVFRKAAEVLDENGVVYVRTDSRPLTLDITCAVLRDVFNHMSLRRYKRPFPGRTQTHLFGSAPVKNGETDIILHPNGKVRRKKRCGTRAS